MIDPRRANRAISWWLLACCALVFGMVVLGGVTRLTGSGLSMVDWRPVLGWLPPLNDAEWQQTFELYQQSPEYLKKNFHMDVHDFKGIFWLEYLHRLLGRLIGVAFLLPFLYFLARGYITLRQTPKYLAMFVLGGLQGVLGWYMVKSGLIDHPEVSQYRLTAHLLLAIAIYAFMLWVALGLRSGPPSGPSHPWLARSAWLTALIMVTITSGGFVAGTKAGFAFNTFPMMGEHWIPPGMMALEPAWRNLFDNIIMVQFNHRLLALTTFALILAYWFCAVRGGLRGHHRTAAHGLLLAALLQVILGIATILHSVPVVLGSAHQAGALVLLTAAIYLLHGLRFKEAANG